MRANRSVVAAVATGAVLAGLASAAPAVSGTVSSAAPAEVMFSGSETVELVAKTQVSWRPSRLESAFKTRTMRPRTRISAPAPAPSPTTSTPRAPEPVPAPVPTTQPVPPPPPAPVTSTSYAFAATDQGQPVRWNPCVALQWVFSTAGAPAGGLELARAAVANLAAATGIDMVYAGTTTAIPNRAWTSTRDDGPALIVGWTTGESSDLLAGLASGVAGVTRWTWWGVPKAGGGYTAVLSRAAIALDSTDRLPMTGTISWRGVLKHELGHAAGLGHVNDTSQLMNPVLTREDFAAGDLAGLSRLGRPAGCI